MTKDDNNNTIELDDSKDNSFARCSFCGRSSSEVKELISSHTAYICASCIHLCVDMMKKHSDESFLNDEFINNINDMDVDDFHREPQNHNQNQKQILLKPSELKKRLDSYVIGQDQAKKVLSVAIYNHYKRINCQSDNSDDFIEKSNVLMIGPTGSGKTLLARRISNELSLPFCVIDATTLTEVGYVGSDVDSIVNVLLQNANNNLQKAQKGVVYIDEIDKISRKVDNHSRMRDISGEGVQEALLKIIEGSEVYLNQQDVIKDSVTGMPIKKIDTSNILFIFGGSFEGIKDIIEKRKMKFKIGFDTNNEINIKEKNDISKDMEASDLIKFGMIPEFVARCPIIVTLNQLTIDDLINILKYTKNSIVNQYTKLLQLDSVKLEITDCGYQEIAKLALKDGSGARSLRRILEDIMLECMFELPDCASEVEKVIIDKDVVLSKNVKYLYNKSSAQL